MNEESVFVCAGDESTNGAIIWDCKSSFSQKIHTRQPVLDIELIENQHLSKDPLLSLLSESTVKLYKM